MSYGDAIGLNYKMAFPGQQPQQVPIEQQAQGNFQDYIPAQSKDPLAVRRKLTSDYYNNYSLLQNIVKDALAQGLNPFEPDYSQDGGGLAFQAFQEAQAGLMYSANALRNEYEAEQQLRPLLAQDKMRANPGVDLQQGMGYSNPDNFYSTAITPGVEQTNQSLAQETNTPNDQARANQLIQQEVAKIDAQIQSGSITPQRGEYLKQQLVENRYKTKVFAPRSDGSSNQPDFLALHKSVANHTRGVWAPETYKNVIVKGNNFSGSE
jgi:hypothetical protein